MIKSINLQLHRDYMARMFATLTLGDVLGRHWGFIERLYDVEAELVEKLLPQKKKSG